MITKRQNKTGPQSLTLTYDLFDQPTAQHKAGLAGLILLIESMKTRKLSPLPDIVDLDRTSVSIRVTLDSLQKLFDDLYTSTLERVESRSKWKGKEPLETLEKTVADPDGTQKKKSVSFMKPSSPKVHFSQRFILTGKASGFACGGTCFGAYCAVFPRLAVPMKNAWTVGTRHKLERLGPRFAGQPQMRRRVDFD